MADGTDTGATTTTTDTADNGGAGKTFTQAELDQIVKDRIGRERGKYSDYDDLKAKAQRLAELEDASKSDLEKLTGERDTLKGRAETAESKLARFDAAAKAGLDIKHAGRIQGSTPEEMEADAKALAEEFKANASTTFDGGARGGGDEPTDMNTLMRRAAGRT